MKLAISSLLLVAAAVVSANEATKTRVLVVNHETLALNVDLADTVGSLKTKIQYNWYVPVDKQVLSFGNNSVMFKDNQRSLADHGYTGEGVTRLLIVPPTQEEEAHPVDPSSFPVTETQAEGVPSGPRVLVANSDSLAFNLDLATDTVGALKAMIQKMWYVPVEAQQLSYGPNSIFLADNSRTLQDYQVTGDGFLKLLIAPRYAARQQ